MTTETGETIVLSGEQLLADIDAVTPGPGELALWWLGQHSFVGKVGQTVIYMDPFLTAMPERRVPALLQAELIRHADIICGTHDHADHIDHPIWPILAQASPQAKFVLPDLWRETLSREFSIPLERMVGLDDNRCATVRGVKISAVAAAHEFFDRDPESGRYPYLGFIFEANGCTWYHAGDTVWYDGLQTKLRGWKFDLMLVPINGRSAYRLQHNIVGNMTYQEAADLTGPLQPGCVIPTHYEMFEINLGEPELFLDYVRQKYPGQGVHRCRHGERMLLQAGKLSVAGPA